MSNDERFRRNVLIYQHHQDFLDETGLNFSAFARQCLDEYMAHYEEFGVIGAVDESAIEIKEVAE